MYKVNGNIQCGPIYKAKGKIISKDEASQMGEALNDLLKKGLISKIVEAKKPAKKKKAVKKVELVEEKKAVEKVEPVEEKKD